VCFLVETVIILSWERNLLALHDLGDVQIEEIAVENGLHDTREDCNQIEMIFHNDNDKSNWRCRAHGNCLERTNSAM